MSETTSARPIEVPTAGGPIWVWGREAGRPIVLLITGFAAEARLWDLAPDMLPEFDYLRIHLPGNHCPAFADDRLATIGAAVSEAIARRFADRPLLLAGFSLGAVVALATRAANLRRLFLVEPVLDTEGLWPIAPWAQRTRSPAEASLLWSALGVGPDGIEPRDYGDLLASLAVPADVVLGGAPLQPRGEAQGLPSLVTPKARAELAAHPKVTTHLYADAGHNVAGQHAWAVFRLLRRRALETLAP